MLPFPERAATETRILLLTPTARDGQLISAMLAEAGISCVVCADLTELCTLIGAGAGAVVLHEEALRQGGLEQLASQLGTQPVWSDLPIIALVAGHAPDASSFYLHTRLGSLYVLERPLRVATLLSAVQTALRNRARQYQVRLLAEVGQILTASLDTQATLDQLTELLVPQLADACTVYLARDGVLRRIRQIFVNPDHAALAAALNAQPDSAAALAPIWQVIERGTPDLRPTIDPQLMLGLATSEQQHALIERFGVRSHVLLPLLVQGRTTGVLALAITDSGRQFGSADLPYLRELTDRLAPALENLELYQAEQHARAEAERAILARDELIALVSHDLKNPLTTLLGHTQLMQRRVAKLPGDQERLVHGLSSIEGAALRMKKQINSLLDAILLRGGQPLDLQRVLVDLSELVRAAVNGAAQTTDRHSLQVLDAAEPLLGAFDIARIERVLDNLLSNAVKYSPAGGTIALLLSVQNHPDGRYGVVQVEDHGLGIPAEDLPQIFAPFSRATNVRDQIQGTGLGLASVRQIVEAHGGWVDATSVVGQGSVFTIALPLLNAERLDAPLV